MERLKRAAGRAVIHSGTRACGTRAVTRGSRANYETLRSAWREPEDFIPVHGEYRHLAMHHAHSRSRWSVAKEVAIACEDGDAVLLSRRRGSTSTARCPRAGLYVDGAQGDVGHAVLRDRRMLAEEGVVVIVVGVDLKSGAILTGPEIVSRGWVHGPESEPLLEDARLAAAKAVGQAVESGSWDADTLKRVTRRAVGALVSERTRRRPMIVPVVMEA